ncbi:hypothetical protein M011DRAFT_455560 [Sporormia fimetaria CBS 119925]|uniref:polynucleotide adenylyltransferase n=1 Tax=Sporormia fimetaria CBS 119925 TaxID=1340428 RepID=A0A6A6VM22_9PLEO|nr:hypothetical protein M011DRAFT_455560 [Sporormia fimetaria CBS 119925]
MAHSSGDRGSFFPTSQRPSLVSQHSNSVPSTPLQMPRQYESRSRSPSPNGGLGSHSPRSVSSEANGPLPTLRTPRPRRCKYETNAAFGRRRIPYESSDLLEQPKEEPKKALDPHEDAKLSGDMRELYDRLLPSAESARRREAFVRKLEHILHTEWPGNEFKVHVFGSSGNMLYTSDSDVDICIQTPMKRLEEMHMLAEALEKHGMQKVICIPQAKVRIVKVWDPELELASDMNVNNTLALENTRMIKTYVQIDDRVRPLAMILKYWTRQRILNDAGTGGTISSYTWICMILNFLQTRDPPILPSLHKLPYRRINEATGQKSMSEFADDLDKLRGFGRENKETLGQLLFNFFRLYGYELDYEKFVISVREGKLLTREEKNWHREGLQKEARNRLCVEEPFNTERNLGNSADEFAWRGIHLEIRRAFDLLAEGQLDKACELYEWPPEEKLVFKKPTPSVKPILQMPNSRGVRGTHRGGRGGFGQKGNYGNGRRASSGASFGTNRPPFAANAVPVEYGEAPRPLNDHLRNQLHQYYASLELQSNTLQAQLLAQQRQPLHVQAAQMHAHTSVAQAQSQSRQGQGPSPSHSGVNGSPQRPFVTVPSSPLLPGIHPSPLHQQYLYHYPVYGESPFTPVSASQETTRTHPSSPSLNSSTPRRSDHRTSNTSETGSTRSHSQPPRGITQPTYPQPYLTMPQHVDMSNSCAYPVARTTPEGASSIPTEYRPVPTPTYQETAAILEQSIPKEYVGYHVADHPATRPSLQEYAVRPIPSFNELRRKRVSPEVSQPLLNTLRSVSRSPSSLGETSHDRSSGGEPQSATSLQSIEPRRPSADSGPVIVNGSFSMQPRGSISHSEKMESFPQLDPLHMPTGSMYAMSNGLEQYGYSMDYRQGQYQESVNIRESDTSAGIGHDQMPTESSERTMRATETSNRSPPFPIMAQNWLPTELDDRRSSAETSPARAESQWQPTPYSNGVGRIDTQTAPRASPQEIKSAGLPLLSPVFETRTPSPTASRQPEPQKLVNGLKPQTKESHPSPRRGSRSSHAHAPAAKEFSKDTGRSNNQKGASNTDKGGKGNSGTHHTGAGTWQPSKKSKRKKASHKHNENKSGGEPMPANAAERKGG